MLTIGIDLYRMGKLVVVCNPERLQSSNSLALVLLKTMQVELFTILCSK